MVEQPFLWQQQDQQKLHQNQSSFGTVYSY